MRHGAFRLFARARGPISRTTSSATSSVASQAGIEPGVLDLLKKHGMTSVTELMARLGIKEEPQQPEGKVGPGNVDEALEKLLGDAPEPTPPLTEATGNPWLYARINQTGFDSQQAKTLADAIR